MKTRSILIKSLLSHTNAACINFVHCQTGTRRRSIETATQLANNIDAEIYQLQGREIVVLRTQKFIHSAQFSYHSRHQSAAPCRCHTATDINTIALTFLEERQETE